MILFSISCETCASRLNVRQKAAIGQVLACPKCGSMVQVHPPEGWKPPANPNAPPPRQPKPPADPNDSQATVETGLSGLDSPTERTPIERPKSGVAAPRRVRSTRNDKQSAGGTATAIDTNASASKNSAKDSGPIMPDGQWTSDAVAKRRKALAWITGILGICLIGLVVGLYTVSKLMNGTSDDPAGDSTKVAKSTEDPKQNAAAENNKNNEKATDDKKNADTKTDNTDPEKQPPPNADTTNDAKDDETGNGGEAKTGDLVIPENPNTTDPVPGVPTEQNPTTGDPNPLPPSDTEEVLDPDAALKAPQALDSEDEKNSVLGNLGDLSDLMNPGINVSGFFEAKTDTQSKLIGIGKVYVPVPKKLDIDLQAAASELYPGIMYTDIPLIELCRNLTRITQVPVQLDHEAIQMGLLDPYLTVSGKVEDASAIDLLRVAIEPANLKVEWDESDTVLVVSPDRAGGLNSFEVTPQHLKLDDPAKAASVIAAIQRIVKPESWNSNGGVGTISYADGKFKIEQAGSLTDLTKQVILKLDLAAAVMNDPADEKSLNELGSNFTRSKNLRESTSSYLNEQNEWAEDVLTRLNRDDGTVILMDWVELMQYDWNPKVRIPWNSNNQTIAKTLNDLTSSMNLAYRILDENTFEITSKRKRDLGVRLEVFPCGKQIANGFNEERILALLQAGIGAEMPPKELAYTWVEYVEETQCVVALLPDPLLISTEKILEQMLLGE